MTFSLMTSLRVPCFNSHNFTNIECQREMKKTTEIGTEKYVGPSTKNTRDPSAQTPLPSVPYRARLLLEGTKAWIVLFPPQVIPEHSLGT